MQPSITSRKRVNVRRRRGPAHWRRGRDRRRRGSHRVPEPHDDKNPQHIPTRTQPRVTRETTTPKHAGDAVIRRGRPGSAVRVDETAHLDHGGKRRRALLRDPRHDERQTRTVEPGYEHEPNVEIFPTTPGRPQTVVRVTNQLPERVVGSVQ